MQIKGIIEEKGIRKKKKIKFKGKGKGKEKGSEETLIF